MPNELVPADTERPLVLQGLIRKRSEIAGEIERLRLEARRLLEELEHVDATIHIFAPDLDVGRIRAKAQRPRLRAANGQVAGAILDMLREADGPLNAVEMARALMLTRGLDPDNTELLALMVNRLRPCLRGQRDRGLVRNVPHPSGLLGWRLAR